MPAPLVIAGAVALRQGAVWVGRRLIVPAGRTLFSGLGRLASRAGRTMSLGSVANALNVFDVAKKATPTHFEEVDVTVFGSPKATKRDLWRIALSAAFGKVQRRDGVRALPPPGFVQMEYPLEGNAVRVVIRMETPYWNLFAGRFRTTREFELYSGPQDDVKGGNWAFTSSFGGVGANFGASYPKTGFEDRTLLTPSPTYRDKNGTLKASSSPHPIADKTSRSSAPVAENPTARLLDPTNTYKDPAYLVYQALSAPCETFLQPPPASPPTPPASSTVTDLITGSPFPLPSQNPSGAPTSEPPFDPDYEPPVPQQQPPAGTTTGQVPSVDPQSPVLSGTSGLGVPIGNLVLGGLLASSDVVQSSITGVLTPFSTLTQSIYPLINSNLVDATRQLYANGTLVPTTPPLNPLNPFSGSSY